MRLRALLVILLIGTYLAGKAQELKVQVRITTPKLQTVDPKVFRALEGDLTEFINNQKWTDDVFESEEVINCNIQMTITEELSPTSFRADLAIQATRPVFGSNYETALINHVDKGIQFEYEQFQQLQYSRNSYNDNLSSVMSFYAYIILGYDYDSFSPQGGEKYFQIAQEIMTSIPPNAAKVYKGWRSLDANQNRFWMIENMLNPKVKPYREAWYNYHMNGLDQMNNNSEQGKANILAALNNINAVNRSYKNSMVITMFADAKAGELIEIFKQSSLTQKNKVFTIMQKVDPSQAGEYRKILR